MARTIAEIQTEIIAEKVRQSALAGLTNESKSAVWRLWTYIVATAIWMHEQIVERNALISRPHTLEWYKAQTLSFLNGRELFFKDGFFEFDTVGLNEKEIEEARIVKYCAVSEVDLDTIINQDGGLTLQGNQNETSGEALENAQNQVLSNYFHNQVGVVFIKVAKDSDSGKNITFLNTTEQDNLKEFVKRIKDAGNQVQVTSIPGDLLSMKLKVYVDPLTIYVNPDNNQEDVNNGILIADGDTKPVEEAIKDYLKNIEFNGALVKTFLIDAVQKANGVSIPVFEEFKSGIHSLNLDDTVVLDSEFYIPKAGYFDLEKLKISVDYFPYTFYRNNQNTF